MTRLVPPAEADTAAEVRDTIERLLSLLGEDPNREGLRKTPSRVEKALRHFTKGYAQDVDALLNGAFHEVRYDEMVVVKDIDFFSLCEHHLLPFFGRCHLAYVPDKKVIGLSKLPRLVEAFSRRLQVQERLTCQIAETIQSKISPKGVAVVMEAQHLCMMMRGVAVVMEAMHLCMLMRGVEKQNSKAVTSAMLGAFRDRPETRAEFMDLIKSGRGLQI
ncbi:MAG: GTP cyclohydrolase I FolE [Planctomycetes bacterium]|nr:GTP cyclohydrolase I FolE [Planctomycetota bacterium]